MQNQQNYPDSAANGLGPDQPLVSADGTRTGVKREFHNFLTDIEDLITSATSLTGDDLAKAKEKLSARIESAKYSLNQMSGALVDRARSGVKATDTYVHDKPWQSIGVGAALGLLIGLVLARR